MVDPKVLLILALLSGTYYVGEVAVKAIKKADVVAVHAVKKGVHGVVHVLTLGHK